MTKPARRQGESERRDLHERFDREDDVRGLSNRGFGLVFAAVLALLGGAKLWAGATSGWWWLAGAMLFLGLAMVRPAALAPLNRLWLGLAALLTRVISPLTIGVLFYLTVTPTGLIMRLLGKDPLRLARDPAARSYWIKREPPGPAPETMRNQF